MLKKATPRNRLADLSTRSGKMDVKKEKVDGIKTAAQKTNRILKVADNGSFVWSTKKIKNIQRDIT